MLSDKDHDQVTGDYTELGVFFKKKCKYTCGTQVSIKRTIYIIKKL